MSMQTKTGLGHYSSTKPFLLLYSYEYLSTLTPISTHKLLKVVFEKPQHPAVQPFFADPELLRAHSQQRRDGSFLVSAPTPITEKAGD